MLNRSIIIAIVAGSLLIGGAITTGIILSQKNRGQPDYYEENAINVPDGNNTSCNSVNINTEQINVDTNGTTVSNTAGPTILPACRAINITNNTQVLIWQDEFDGEMVDTNKWMVIDWPGTTGYGNNELQTYHKDHVDVYNGAMHIMASREGDEWLSGRVESKQSWTPGMIFDNKVVTKIYFESSIHTPDSGNGLWPGFWFFPDEYVYGDYAASGEIDAMELRDSYDSITCGVHYGGPETGYDGISNLRNMTRTSNADGASFSNKNLIFGVEWALDTIVFFVNGVEMTRRHSKAIDPVNGWFSAASNAKISSPFDIPFKAIYNIAVGGNFPQHAPDENTPNEVMMSVDYFRVFADFA